MKVKKGLSKRSGDCPSGQSVAEWILAYVNEDSSLKINLTFLKNYHNECGSFLVVK